MKSTYLVAGMTCNGCRASVENKLKSIPEVLDVFVSLETSEAIIKTDQPIAIDKLRSVLPEKYSITTGHPNNNANNKKPEYKSELKQLFPLFLIFAYILTASVLLNIKPWNLGDFMLDFMGLFYIVFSFFKLLDLKGFPESFRMYDPLTKALPIYAWVYPFIEVALGLMFLTRVGIPSALIVTLIILGTTTIGVTKSLLDKKSIACACLGTALKLPMTKATFIENSIMIVMAIFMLIKTF